MSNRWREEDNEVRLREGGIFVNPAIRKHINTERLTADWRIKKSGEANIDRRIFDPVDAGIAISSSAWRVRTYYAQALILFNVYGLPLSFGPYLEYYFTTALSTTPLWSLSLIVALQILCISAAPYPVWILYQRWTKWRKLMMFVAMMIVVGAHGSLTVCKSHVGIMLLQGFLMGSGLGALSTLSLLFLGSHYRFNLPLVSWQSAIGTFLGAIVYTVTAWLSLRNENLLIANGVNSGISTATLLTAVFLAKHSKRSNVQLLVQAPPSLWDIFMEKGTFWFVIGYIFVFFGLFIWPIYLFLILSNTPALQWPDTGGYTLLAMFGTATLSSPICPNVHFRRHLGPVESFSAACLFAAASMIAPTWVPQFWFAVGGGAAYGIALGIILTLHIKVGTVFHPMDVVWHPDMPVRSAFMMALGGISAAAGLVTAAVLLEYRENGARIVALLAMMCMTFGGVIIAAVRWVR